jgi:hypothetical protein
VKTAREPFRTPSLCDLIGFFEILEDGESQKASHRVRSNSKMSNNCIGCNGGATDSLVRFGAFLSRLRKAQRTTGRQTTDGGRGWKGGEAGRRIPKKAGNSPIAGTDGFPDGFPLNLVLGDEVRHLGFAFPGHLPCQNFRCLRSAGQDCFGNLIRKLARQPH